MKACIGWIRLPGIYKDLSFKHAVVCFSVALLSLKITLILWQPIDRSDFFFKMWVVTGSQIMVPVGVSVVQAVGWCKSRGLSRKVQETNELWQLHTFAVSFLPLAKAFQVNLGVAVLGCKYPYLFYMA